MMKRILFTLLASGLLSAEAFVTNGSFETWLPFTGKTTDRTPTLIGGLIPLGWTVAQEKPGVVVRAEQNTAGAALVLEHAAANTSGAEQYISVSPNSTYRVRCRVKAENIIGNGIVIWLNTGPSSDFHAKQKRTATYPPKRAGSYDWQDYEYTLKTDADTAVLRINISLQMASGKAWFDVFEITREGAPVMSDTVQNTKAFSDHIDVTSDVSPKAAGDGSTDDTAALQAALDRISNDSKNAKVMFMPKGIYRITRTLVITKNQGGAVIGEEGTRIVWDGETGGRMLHANGASRHRYINIIWDGKGKAGVGIDHDSKTYYETRVRHENEQFLDFTIAGIRGGHDPKVTPSAEFFIENCRFERCEKGVSLLLWNYYDNFFTDCEFIDCGNAIYCEKGNFAVRRSRFERSKDADMVITTHSFSVRRSVSVGSGQFIRTFHSGPHGASLMVEGCRIDSWKNRNAITLAYMGAATVIDTVFSNPPSQEPPIAFTGDGSYSQSLIHSSCTATGMRAIAEPSKVVRILEIPAGRRGLVPPINVRFSKQIPAPYQKVFDARRDFGAAANGSTDDTEALQRTIDAAKAFGKGAVAYLPFGTYRTTRTIRVSGADYTVLGSGFATILSFAADEGIVLSVEDPKAVSLEQFRIEVPEATSDRFVKIAHRTTGGSFAVYDGVYAGGSWRKGKPMIHGLAAESLGPTDMIRLKHFDGSVRIRDNAGTVFADHIIDGELIVEGAENAGKGFVGVWARICSGNPYDNIVRDNNDLILADYYTEQTEGSLRAEGGASPRTDGRITFHCAKQGWMQVLGALKPGEHKSDGILIDNYGGAIFYTGALMFYQKPTLITQTGTKPVSMVFAGNSFGHVAPEFKGESLTPVLAENYIILTKGTGDELCIPNIIPDGALASMTKALDHFREFGEREKAFAGK